MPTLLAARLDGAHDAAHDELAAALHQCCAAVAAPAEQTELGATGHQPGHPGGWAGGGRESQSGSFVGVGGNLVACVLADRAAALPADARLRLADAFVAADPTDLPTFGRALSCLANDVRHLLALSQQHTNAGAAA